MKIKSSTTFVDALIIASLLIMAGIALIFPSIKAISLLIISISIGFHSLSKVNRDLINNSDDKRNI